MIFKELKIADYLTLTGTALAILALWLLAREKINISISVALVSMFFDFIDGKVARVKGSSLYGKYLDSLYDLIGFVLYPVMLVWQQQNNSALALIVTTAFVLTASIRLARFTDEGLKGKKPTRYVGMPVLYSFFAVVLVSVFDGYMSLFWLAVMSMFMITNLPFTKPRHPIFGLGLLFVAGFYLYV